MVAVNDTIPCKQLEVVTICLGLGKPVTLRTVYCAPNSNPDHQNSLNDYLRSLVQSSNVPEINWATLCGYSNYSSARCDLFMAVIYLNYLVIYTYQRGNFGLGNC